jgi:ATP-dependent exoDNAse (exonuclease V) beta subunit
VWWDPNQLVLDVESLGGGMRQRHILEADEKRTNADASIAAQAAWRSRHDNALAIGKTPSVRVESVTRAAKQIAAGDAPVVIADTGVDRSTRPRGKRFGTLVHAALAAVELTADAAAVQTVVASQARLVGASRAEIDAAVIAVQAALAHPLLVRAAAAPELRREVPLVLHEQPLLIEGIVDLAFGEHDGWLVVDFKSDAELDGKREVYEAQVRLYAKAIERAMGQPCSAALLVV